MGLGQGSINSQVLWWIMGLIGALLIGIIAFIGNSTSGELKELRKDVHTSEERLSVVETMVDNIRDDVKEIKEDVKINQETAQDIDKNIDQIKTMIMEERVKRAEERRMEDR